MSEQDFGKQYGLPTFIQMDWLKVGSIALNVVLLLLLGYGSYKHFTAKAFSCDECADKVVVKTDTVWEKEKLQLAAAEAPKPFKVVRSHQVKQPISPKDKKAAVAAVTPPKAFHGSKGGRNNRAEKLFRTPPEPKKKGNATKAGCPESITSYYSDTLQVKNRWYVVVNDTVQGAIAGRSVYIAPIRRTIRTERTITQKERWKVYVGLNATVNADEIKRWGAGPSIALAIPKIGMADYYYDAHNNAHSFGFKALIRFRR